MKHIVIPCDLTIQSLQPIHDVMAQYPGEKLKITLLHLLDVPTGISDLIRRPSNLLPKGTISEQFSNACEVLKNRYASRIEYLQVLVKQCGTKSMFTNLMEGMEVDAIFVSRNSRFELPTTRSVDVTALLGKGVNHLVREVDARPSLVHKEVSLSGLLVEEEYTPAYQTI